MIKHLLGSFTKVSPRKDEGKVKQKLKMYIFQYSLVDFKFSFQYGPYYTIQIGCKLSKVSQNSIRYRNIFDQCEIDVTYE